jgi:hypothetical protein
VLPELFLTLALLVEFLLDTKSVFCCKRGDGNEDSIEGLGERDH